VIQASIFVTFRMPRAAVPALPGERMLKAATCMIPLGPGRRLAAKEPEMRGLSRCNRVDGEV